MQFWSSLIFLSLTTPNPPKSSKWHFFRKNQHYWKLVLSPLQMGQNYYLARSTGHKCLIWKINENAWYILKIHVRACIQKMDFGGFRNIPSQNTQGVRVKFICFPYHQSKIWKLYTVREIWSRPSIFSLICETLYTCKWLLLSPINGIWCRRVVCIWYGK